MLGGSLMLGATGCTDKFEDFNTDPKAPTPEQMEGDFASTATLLSAMMPVLVENQQNNYQWLDQMVGCEYGRMTAALNQWGSGTFYATYNVGTWAGNRQYFNIGMPQIYTQFFRIRDISGGQGLTYHWANLIRIAGTLRISDCFGPMPFSLIGNGNSYQVAYDDMPDLYNAMFDELDRTIAGLKESVGSSTTQSIFGQSDIIYSGDISKWVKFANTTKLRMAMRLVNVNPTLARQKAEEAVNDPGGLISTADEAAWCSDLTRDGNPLYITSIEWGESRFSADLSSYMNGYSDPRLPIYVSPADNGQYIGARHGVFRYPTADFQKYSKPNITNKHNEPLLCLAACESWFARAEGALRGWNMGGTAKELYEQGVKVSMEERGASIGDYLNSTATPANYVALDNSTYNIVAASSICPKYDEEASFDTNLERIIVQKWIGNYPNGWESWADFRRTGYPKWFPVVNNMSTDGVSSTRGVRRLAFPQSEYNTNEANVREAVRMLGGPDNMATDLWWAKQD